MKMEGKFVNKIWFWCTIQNDFVLGRAPRVWEFIGMPWIIQHEVFRESMPKLTRFAFKLDAVLCGIQSHPWLRFKLDDSITVSSCESPRYCGKNSGFLNVYGAKILGSRVVSISFFIQRIAMTQRVAVTARRSYYSGCLFSPHAKLLPSHSSPHRLLPN